MQNSITVRVLKHDGSEYRRWTAQLARREGSLIVLDAEFDIDVSHELLGRIARGTRTVEYYWMDRWYNIFRFLNDDGTTRLWYCNVNTPPELREQTLTYVDLDLDILVQPDFSARILDAEEFEMNAGKFGYSDEEKLHARNAVDELIGMIERREFPFVVESAPVSALVNQ